ncbi:MAG: alpha/beta hydrolase [Opitutus sp.]|nr:alpha/beta hydrolase [Opitutus sp.]
MSAFSTVQLSAADGTPVTACYFPPRGEPRGAVLIVPAMGCPQAFYAPLAAWLAAQAFLVATFDYRGIGLSRPAAGLRGFQADILDWARLDCGALVEDIRRRAPALPLYWIGHSLGGQILPFVPGREHVRKMVTVTAGSGYWLDNASALRWRVWFLWYCVVPVALPFCGYFPGRRLRMVGDLPRAAMAQWRRWCLHPDYAAGAEGEAARGLYAAVRTPITALSFTDDEMMSARNIERLHATYANAPRRMVRLAPAEVGAKRIGHFGFFRREFQETLWRRHLLSELA